MSYFSEIFSNARVSLTTKIDEIVENPMEFAEKTAEFAAKTASVAVIRAKTSPYLVEYPLDQIYALPDIAPDEIRAVPVRAQVFNMALGFAASQVTGALISTAVTAVGKQFVSESDLETAKAVTQVATTLVFNGLASNLSARVLGTHPKQLSQACVDIKKLPMVIDILGKQIKALDKDMAVLLRKRKNAKNSRVFDEKISALALSRDRKIELMQNKTVVLKNAQAKGRRFGFQ